MNVDIKYLGHAAFEITSAKGIKILVDPYISRNPMCPAKVDDFKEVDLMLVSHGALDHLGDAFTIVKNTGATMVCGPDINFHAQRRGVPQDQIRTLVWGGIRKVGGITVRAVEARHGSNIFTKEGFISSTPLSFVIYMENGLRIYHPGDTSIFSDLQLIGQLYRPDIGMYGVGGMAGLFSEMSPAEAAMAARWIGAGVAIPMHYEPGSKEPEEFADCVKKLAPWMKVVTMKPGQVLRYGKTVSVRVI